MASLDELLQQLGFGGVTRNRAGQIVTNTNDVIPVATAGLADTLYGAGRGTLAGTAAVGGIPGDINQMYVNKFGALFPNQPAPPTSEQISTAVKRAVPPLNLSRDNTGRVATSLGENVVSPMVAPEALLTAGVKTAKYAAPVVGKAAENYAARSGLLQPIVPYEVAKNIQMETKLPTSAEFASAVQNTPGARITEDGLAIRLQRNQVPEQSGQESVRTGVFYLPEGAASAKYYKTGKTGYGGKEEIVGETVLKNPLFVKGATGGKAPEAAYDSIMGKNAYKDMRSEVLNSYSVNSRESDKIVAVQGLLEKYNELDPSDAYDMAANIVQNSKSGNTLPYAVQENIVANAVRNAGHDAVLGYSKGKSGNFLSEVFDLRELDYPTKEGGFRLNPMFEQ